jgi:hypothetical protein
METEKAILKKAEGIQTDGGNGAGERIELGGYGVLNAFDLDVELTDFIEREALKDCSEDYNLLTSFLEWTDKTGVGKDEFGNLTKTANVDILAEVTTPFLNVGFAVGYLFAQNFKTDDPKAIALLDELKGALIKKGLWPFTNQWQERISVSISSIPISSTR